MENDLEVDLEKVRAVVYYRHSVQTLSDRSIAFQRDQVRNWAGEHGHQHRSRILRSTCDCNLDAASSADEPS